MKGWYRVSGRILDKKTGRPIPNLGIRGYDRDLVHDDCLGETYTDVYGAYEILFQEKDFKGLFEGQPEIYRVLYSNEGEEVLRTEAVQMRRGRQSISLNLVVELPEPTEESPKAGSGSRAPVV